MQRPPRFGFGLSILMMILGSMAWLPGRANLAIGSSSSSSTITTTLQSSTIAIDLDVFDRTEIQVDVFQHSVLKAHGVALSQPGGYAVIGLRDLSSSREYYPLQIGDTLTVSSTAASQFAMTLPTLVAELDAEHETLTGFAPANSVVEVFLNEVQSDGSAERKTVGTRQADASGLLSETFSGSREISEGETGKLVLEISPGVFVQALMAAPVLRVTPEVNTLTGVASPGSTISIEVVGANGVSTYRAGVSPTGVPDWSLALPVTASLVSGSTVNIIYQSPKPLSTERRTAIPIARLTINADIAGNRVFGEGPPGAELVLRGRNYLQPISPIIEREVKPLADGSYQVILTDVTLDYGWELVISELVKPGVYVQASRVLRLLRIPLYGVGMDGSLGVPPGEVVQVQVWDAQGVKKAQGTVAILTRNRFSLEITPARFEPGDIVEIEVAQRDPWRIVLPAMTVYTDYADNSVKGIAPSNAKLRLEARIMDRNVSQSGTIDASGAYRVAYPEAKISPGTRGAVVAALPSGVELGLGWSSLKLNASLSTGLIGSSGPAGRAITGSLLSRLGLELGRMQTEVGPSNSVSSLANSLNWSAYFHDSAGQIVTPRGGDQFVLRIGDEVIKSEVPPLTISASVAENVIEGTTAPGASVLLRLQRASVWGGSLYEQAYVTTAIADRRGQFDYDLTGEAVMQANDEVVASVSSGGVTYVTIVGVAGLSIDLPESKVSGRSDPDRPVKVTVLRGARTVIQVATQSTFDGRFAALIQNSADHSDVPRPGDHVVADFWQNGSLAAVTMTMPAFTFNVDASQRRVSGEAPAGGQLWLVADAAFRRSDLDSLGINGKYVFPELSSRFYTVTFKAMGDPESGGLITRPGMRFKAAFRDRSGAIVRWWRVLPIMNIHQAGDRICGYARPEMPVEATLLEDENGNLLGSGRTQAGPDGRFDLHLVDSRGRPVSASEGQLVRVWTGQETLSARLLQFDIDVAWSVPFVGWGQPKAKVTAIGPFNTNVYYAVMPGEDCFSTLSGNFLDQVASRGRATQFIDPPGPGSGIQFAYYLPNGQRVYRGVRRLLGRVYVGTDMVAGLASDGTDVQIDLHGPDGQPRGQSKLSAAPEGDFTANLRTSDGLPLVIKPGDTVSMTAAKETISIPVTPLTFDFDASSGLVGASAPNGKVQVSLFLTDGRVLTFDRECNDRGVFSYGIRDMPSGASWQFGEIAHVVVMAKTPEGHEIVAEGDVNGRHLDSTTRPTRLWLPKVVLRAPR